MTEAEYEAAMRRIDQIFGAASGTPEGDELDRLATAVAAYEEKHFPIAKPTEQEMAAFRCDQRGRHLPMKAALDTSVWCTYCGTYLGETSSEMH